MVTADLLLPCIYVYIADSPNNFNWVHSNMLEAVRIRTDLLPVNPGLVVLPYARVRYAPSGDYMTLVRLMYTRL